MPWIQVGGYRLDLDRVELAYEVPGGRAGQRSVTITMVTGMTVELAGGDAQKFLERFDEYRAATDIDANRGPPANPVNFARAEDATESAGRPSRPAGSDRQGRAGPLSIE